MLIKAEIYKIFSEKRITAAILCLLLLNAAVCFFSMRSDDTAVPAKTTDEYEEIIQQVIAQANTNIIEYEARGYGPADYLYRKQLKCIDIYTELPDKVELMPELIRGWDDYFMYDSVNIFIFAAILIVSTVVFAQENNSGFVSIIRTSARGRFHTAGAKIAAMLLLTCILLLMFTAETLIIFGSTVGFSSHKRDSGTGEIYIQSLHALHRRISRSYGIIQGGSLHYRVGYLSLLLHEMYKTLISSRYIILAAVLLTCFILSLSAILHRHIVVMTTAAVVTLLPALLSYFGLAIFAKADFTAMMRATPVFMQDGMLVYAVLAVVCCITGSVFAGKLWERHG